MAFNIVIWGAPLAYLRRSLTDHVNVTHHRVGHTPEWATHSIPTTLKLYLPPTYPIKLKNLYIYKIRASTRSMPNSATITASWWGAISSLRSYFP